MSLFFGNTPLNQVALSPSEHLRDFSTSVDVWRLSGRLQQEHRDLIAVDEGPTDADRERLKQLSLDHFMAREKVMAEAQILKGMGLLERCAVLMDDQPTEPLK
jgi:hypothetical protein